MTEARPNNCRDALRRSCTRLTETLIGQQTYPWCGTRVGRGTRIAKRCYRKASIR